MMDKLHLKVYNNNKIMKLVIILLLLLLQLIYLNDIILNIENKIMNNIN